ncbi:MAG: hypothetical protein WAM92_14910, partial [Mycobacterium sp.]
ASPQRDSGGRSGQWVLPTVIAIAAALILGAIGVVIGLLANQNSSSTDDSALTASSRVPASGYVTSPRVTTSSATPTAQPSLVQSADAYGDTCGQGIALPNTTGFGSRAGRGSDKTSCYFARRVLEAYWAQHGRPTTALQFVTASSRVTCPSTGSSDCVGNDFRMRCEGAGSGSWVTCTGGDDARVYLY